MQPEHNSSLASEKTNSANNQFRALAVSPPDLNSPSAMETERVNVHIQAVITYFLEALQIPESSVVRPVVFVSPNLDTSCCKSAVNEIHIIPEQVGRLDVYGEEVSHWLRFQMSPPKRDGMWALTDDRQVAVEEFFGYLGFCLARQLCSGAELRGLRNSYTLESAPDVVRTYRSNMATAERQLGLLRDFAESEKAFELRTIAKGLTSLHDQLQNPANDTMGTLILWDSIHTDLIQRFAAEPIISMTEEGGTFELEAILRSALTKFAHYLTETIAPPAGTPATHIDGQAINVEDIMNTYTKVAQLLTESITAFFEALDRTELRLVHAHQSLIDHCDGYEAATVFLRNS